MSVDLPNVHVDLSDGGGSSNPGQSCFEDTVNLSMLSCYVSSFFTSLLSEAYKNSSTGGDLSKASEVLGKLGDGFWLIDLINTGNWWLTGQHESWMDTTSKICSTVRQVIDGVEFFGVNLDSICNTVGGVPVLGVVMSSMRIVGSSCALIHTGMRLRDCRVAKREDQELRDLCRTKSDRLAGRVNELFTKYFKEDETVKKFDNEKERLQFKAVKLSEFLKSKINQEKDLRIQMIGDINTLVFGIFLMIGVFCLQLEGVPTNLLALYVFGFMTVQMIYDLHKRGKKEKTAIEIKPLQSISVE